MYVELEAIGAASAESRVRRILAVSHITFILTNKREASRETKLVHNNTVVLACDQNCIFLCLIKKPYYYSTMQLVVNTQNLFLQVYHQLILIIIFVTVDMCEVCVFSCFLAIKQINK